MRQFILKNKIFLIPILIALIVFIGLNIFPPKTESPEEYFETHFALGWTEFDVKGTVKKKYISNSHNNPTILVDCNGKEYEFYFQTNDTEFYNYVNIGDSILSNRKSFKATVRKIESDSVFHFIDNN